MNLFELFVKIGAEDEASGVIDKVGEKAQSVGGAIGNALKVGAKIGLAAVGAASGGIIALGKEAITQYADYEQLVGGVETLFKDSADKVIEYAAGAYQTAGMSANEYMETVTSFSASLIQSLDGDTEAAVEAAHLAIVDMSDNANKMGTSMEMIQNAYQGFAKQNYTMLDNLKLGYGGTKEEMVRLVDDANAILESQGKVGDLVAANFSDVVTAIHLVQTEMGITGTTAKEAGSTISGSVASMKAAWANLLTGIADENADFEKLVDNLVVSLVGDGSDSNLGVIGNLIPRIEKTLSGIGKLAEKAVVVIGDLLPGLISSLLPSIISAATDLVIGVANAAPTFIGVITDGFLDAAPKVINAGVEIINKLTSGFTGSASAKKMTGAASSVISLLIQALSKTLPNVIGFSIDLLLTFAEGIADNVDVIVSGLSEMIVKIANRFTDPSILERFVLAAREIIEALLLGIADALPRVVESAAYIINNIVRTLTDPRLIDSLFEAGDDISYYLVQGFESVIPRLLEVVGLCSYRIVTTLTDSDTLGRLVDAASSIVMCIVSGISDMLPSISGAGSGIISRIARTLSDSDLLSDIVDASVNILLTIVQAVSDPDLLLSLVDAAVALVDALVLGIEENLGTIIQAAGDAIFALVGALTNPEALSKILASALDLIVALAEGLLSEESIDAILESAFLLIGNLIAFLLDGDNITNLISAATDVVAALAKGLGYAVYKLVEESEKLVQSVVDSFNATDWAAVGENIINSVLEGLKKAWAWLSYWLGSSWNELMDLFGIEGMDVNVVDPTIDYSSISRTGGISQYTEAEKTKNSALGYEEEERRQREYDRVIVNQTIINPQQTAADLMEEARYEMERSVLTTVQR